MLRCALGTGWWIEIKMRLGSWEVNATTMEALLLWSIASPRVRRLRRSYAAIPPRTFSVKIAGGEGERVGMYDLVCLGVLVSRDSWAVVSAQST